MLGIVLWMAVLAALVHQLRRRRARTHSERMAALGRVSGACRQAPVLFHPDGQQGPSHNQGGTRHER